MAIETVKPSRGYPIAMLSAVVLSTTAIFIRYLTQTFAMPPLVLAAWRDGFVTLTLLVVLGLFRGSLLSTTSSHKQYLILYGFVLAMFNAFWTTSVALSGAAIATVLAYSSAAFTALLGWWFFKERLDGTKLIVVALSLTGCALVSGALDAQIVSLGILKPASEFASVQPVSVSTAAAASLESPGSILGIFTGLLSGLCYALYSLMGRSASRRGLNPWTTLFYTFAFAGLFLLVINLLPGGLVMGAARRPADLWWLGNSLPGWGALFLLAAGPTVLGFGLYNISLSHLPSSVANLILTSEPVFTGIVAYLVLGERLSGSQIMGGVMILAGVIVLRLRAGEGLSPPGEY